jgi:hypothetical protein
MNLPTITKAAPSSVKSSNPLTTKVVLPSVVIPASPTH